MRAFTISLVGLLVAIHISLCDGINSNVLCIESERQALLKFKQDLIDPSNRLSSWVEGDNNCCEWIGVVCKKFTGHVNNLHLGVLPSDDAAMDVDRESYDLSKLSGKINPSFLNLKRLSFLDLSNNGFEGEVPEFIGSLKSLTYLNFSGAGFEGEIPHQLGNLTNLQHLDLGHNGLEAKTLLWVSGLSSLQYLDLAESNLNAATDWVQVKTRLPFLVELHLSGCNLINNDSSSVSVNYTSLAVLDLSFNFFSSVPTWIFSLPSLVSINLGASLFSSSHIPNQLSNLNKLQFLGLSGVDLHGNVPCVIANLTSLTHLDLSVNQFEKIVPKCLERHSNLREIDLSYNRIEQDLSEIIESLTRYDRLESINLASNKLSGQFTDRVGQFKNLTYLSLFDNSISGPIPSSIGILPQLKVLDVSGNSISGPIPFSIGKLSLLKVLCVSNNRFNGSLPQSLGQLGNLETLDVSSNMLEGNISELHFSNLTRLRSLKASNNMLTFKPNLSWTPPFHCETIELRSWSLGPLFPEWLQSQPNLSSLDISHAGISGVIPTWLWNLSTKFQYVNFCYNQISGGISYLPVNFVADLSSNQLKGPLPPTSSDLTALFLSHNLLSGSVSNFLCNSSAQLKYLKVLDIESNLLSNEIPDCWENYQFLSVLNLGNNKLIGKIPPSMGSMSRIVSLSLRSNGLFGEIPSSLENLSNMLILDLSGNQFTGNIPTWIGYNISRLVVLNLQSSNFQGYIPHQICGLNYLQVLDLGDNNISGAIPKCFTNLSAMATKPLDRYDRIVPWTYDFLLRLGTTLVMKGREDEYSATLGLVTSVDLSANRITGELFKEVGNLMRLRSLNLSGNLLTGKIPETISNMELLESLDLSKNRLHGEIPPGLSN